MHTLRAPILKHRGRFSISFELLENEPNTVQAILEGIIILRAEADYASDKIDYVGASFKFAEVEDGYLTPEYHFNITVDENKVVKVIEAVSYDNLDRRIKYYG